MVTIGLSIFFQAAMNWMFGVFVQPFPRVFEADAVSILGLNVQPVYVMSLAISLVVMALFAWFFKFSRMGLAMRATAFDQQVAQSLGISVKQVFAISWAISAMVSALAGVVMGIVNGVSSALSFIGIKVFPAVILGGLDSIIGAVVGGLIIGVLENVAEFADGQYLHWGNMFTIAPFYILIIILMVKPYGLFGTEEIERVWRPCRSPPPNPCGDFRTSYRADTTIFQTRWSFYFCLAASRWRRPARCSWTATILTLMIQIGYLGIAALGLNILVGFTGQISLGHSAFFGFGAFASAWINNSTGIPVFFSIPLAGVLTTAVGMIFGVPASRIKGLLPGDRDPGGAVHHAGLLRPGRMVHRRRGGRAGRAVLDLRVRLRHRRAVPLRGAGLSDRHVCGRGQPDAQPRRPGVVAVRDHYLSAEMMGINLAKYRILSFGISSSMPASAARCSRITFNTSRSKASTSCCRSSSWA